jgi:DsbC/DsbD-like thiol-disulfide interchange protein
MSRRDFRPGKRNKYCFPRKEIPFLRIILSIIIFFFFLCGSVLTEAKEEEVVTVKTFISHDGIHQGKSFKVALLLNITPGWHIYGPELLDEFLIPSELIIDEDDKIKVLKLYYSEPGSGKFEYSEVELQVYEGEVLLGALIKVSDDIALKKHSLKASLFYQPCDDRTCMAPRTLELEIPFKVVSPSKKIKEINTKIFSKIDFKKESK